MKSTRLADRPLAGPHPKKSIRPSGSGHPVGFPTPPQPPVDHDCPDSDLSSHEHFPQTFIQDPKPQGFEETDVISATNIPFTGLHNLHTPEQHSAHSNGYTHAQPELPLDDQPSAADSNIDDTQIKMESKDTAISCGQKSSDTSKPTIGPNPPKKRTRATPEQLAILEETFMTNTSPNSKLREQLSRRLGMTERSIQIWFQNRRAKVKMMHKRSCQMQEEALRAQMAMMPHFLYRYGYNGAPNGRLPLPPRGPPTAQNSTTLQSTGMVNQAMMAQRPPVAASLFENQRGWMSTQNTPAASPMLPGQATPAYPSPIFTATTSPVVQGGRPHGATSAPADGATGIPRSPTSAAQLACDALTIGTWRRVSLNSTDLRCYCDFGEKKMAWFISDNSHQFKMEFPISAITGIEFLPIENGIAGQLSFDLCQPPAFFMEVRVTANPVWTLCRDFTEGKQASNILKHVLRGNAPTLKSQILGILEVEMSLQRNAIIAGRYFENQLPTPGSINHFRRHSGPPLPHMQINLDSGLPTTPPVCTAGSQVSLATPVDNLQPQSGDLVTRPKRSNSVPMIPTYRSISMDASRQEMTATTTQNSPHGTPSIPQPTPVTPSSVSDQHLLNTPAVTAPPKVFQLTHGHGLNESPMLSIASPIAGMSLSTPQFRPNGDIPCGRVTVDGCSPLEHTMPPAAFSQPTGLSLPPTSSHLAYPLQPAINTPSELPNVDPKLLSSDKVHASIPSASAPDSLISTTTAGAASSTSNGVVGMAPSDFLFESDLLNLCNQDVLV